MQLWIINGPSGVGKSTIAALVNKEMPMSFLLDIDQQRRYFSHHREYVEESRKMMHEIGRSIVRTCLATGHDVILEKLMLKDEIIDAYRAIADEFGAEIREYIFWAPKQLVMERAHARGWREGGLLTPEKCELFWEKMNVFKDQRKQATIIDATVDTPEEIVKQLV